jgi:hypothetical protein
LVGSFGSTGGFDCFDFWLLLAFPGVEWKTILVDPAQIEIVKQDSETFQVTVRAKSTTVHIVTLTHDDYQRLTAGKVTPEKLIEKSFEFLLERESNTSILSSFELPVIGRYFPEYEKTIVKRL